MSKAKLVREIPQREGLPWYFRDYELECIDCGEHYTSGRYDSRTSPYCWKCKRIHDKEKAKERAEHKKQAEINEVLDKIIDEIRMYYTGNDTRNNGLDIAIRVIEDYKEWKNEGVLKEGK